MLINRRIYIYYHWTIDTCLLLCPNMQLLSTRENPKLAFLSALIVFVYGCENHVLSKLQSNQKITALYMMVRFYVGKSAVSGR